MRQIRDDWYKISYPRGIVEPTCQNCRQRPASEALALPTGERASLCPACHGQIAKVFDDPLRGFQFDRILEAFPVDATSVMTIPWRSSRDEVIKLVPAPIRNTLLRTPNRSSGLLGAPITVDGYHIKLNFQFGEEGLDGLTVLPEKAVLDIYGPLVSRFGRVWQAHEMPSLSGRPERHSIWRCEGFEVMADVTAYSTVVVVYQLPRYSDLT